MKMVVSFVLYCCAGLFLVYMMVMNAVPNVLIGERITKFFIFADFLNAL